MLEVGQLKTPEMKMLKAMLIQLKIATQAMVVCPILKH
jgi:hypothetical protein